MDTRHDSWLNQARLQSFGKQSVREHWQCRGAQIRCRLKTGQPVWAPSI